MEKYKIEVSTDNTDNQTCKIIITGDTGISNIEKIKNTLMEKIDGYENIRITVKDVLFIDLSFMQLILSLDKSQQFLNKTIKTDIELNREFEDLITSSGFNIKYGYEQKNIDS